MSKYESRPADFTRHHKSLVSKIPEVLRSLEAIQEKLASLEDRLSTLGARVEDLEGEHYYRPGSNND